jgi:hypothetical protein
LPKPKQQNQQINQSNDEKGLQGAVQEVALELLNLPEEAGPEGDQ